MFLPRKPSLGAARLKARKAESIGVGFHLSNPLRIEIIMNRLPNQPAYGIRLAVESDDRLRTNRAQQRLRCGAVFEGNRGGIRLETNAPTNEPIVQAQARLTGIGLDCRGERAAVDEPIGFACALARGRGTKPQQNSTEQKSAYLDHNGERSPAKL